MAGTGEDNHLIRQAQIFKFINQLYEDAYQDWSIKHPSKVLELARHAYALSQYRRHQMPPGATALEAFTEFRDWSGAKD